MFSVGGEEVLFGVADASLEVGLNPIEFLAEIL
jgi:hypothetical protein